MNVFHQPIACFIAQGCWWFFHEVLIGGYIVPCLGDLYAISDSVPFWGYIPFLVTGEHFVSNENSFGIFTLTLIETCAYFHKAVKQKILLIKFIAKQN